jgi:hypothetical protein
MADSSALGAARRDFTALALAPERRGALGLFLRHLARGERVARRLAAQQAAIAPGRHETRFLRAQARQEATHALLFDTFAALLGAAPIAFDPCPYAAFEARTLAALRRHDFAESVVATQIVLEALGDALLARLDAGLERQRAGFARLRATIRRQEATHRAFGDALIAGLVDTGALDSATARTIAEPYLVLAGRMITSGEPALVHFKLSAEVIDDEMRARLPAWAK